MNIINISGRIANELELKQTSNGKSYVGFSVAVKDGKDKTYFIPVKAWDKTAGFICDYFTKGKGIEVTGKLTVNPYTDSNGVKRVSIEVVPSQVGFTISDNATSGQATEDTDGDLPF